jgi:hypothetical protein
MTAGCRCGLHPHGNGIDHQKPLCCAGRLSAVGFKFQFPELQGALADYLQINFQRH